MNIITITPLTGRFVHKLNSWQELYCFVRACKKNQYRYFKEQSDV
jgi:hypothetical protein